MCCAMQSSASSLVFTFSFCLHLLLPTLCPNSHTVLVHPTLSRSHSFCVSGEGNQSVLTLFCSGAAQVVCHALRVVELREQLEVEEEDGDRQEEEEEEKGEVESRRVRHVDDHGWSVKALRT